MLRKAAKSTISIPTRPSQPRVEQILEDIKCLDDSDPLFTALQNDNNKVNQDSAVNDLAEQGVEDLPQPNKEVEDSGEAVYENVEQLLKLHAELTAAPAILRATVRDLKILGEQLTDSVSALQGQADIILNSNKSIK